MLKKRQKIMANAMYAKAYSTVIKKELKLFKRMTVYLYIGLLEKFITVIL